MAASGHVGVWKHISFAVLVTLAMNALDMVYHIFTDTAVHLGYVAVKFTVIFLVVFLVDWLVGRSWKDVAFGSIAGPFIFFLYYRVATPTLNRSVFVLDEAVWYVLIHTIALFVAYWLACWGVHRRDVRGATSRGFLTAATFICLDLGFRMVEERLRLGEEGVLSVAIASYVVPHVLFVFVAFAVLLALTRDAWKASLVASVLATVALTAHDWVAMLASSLGPVIDGVVFLVLLVGVTKLVGVVHAQGAIGR